MISYKQYIMKLFKGRTVHFKCNCFLNLDITGNVCDVELNNNEIVFILFINNKKIKIGENTPGLQIEFK